MCPLMSGQADVVDSCQLLLLLLLFSLPHHQRVNKLLLIVSWIKRKKRYDSCENTKGKTADCDVTSQTQELFKSVRII